MNKLAINGGPKTINKKFEWPIFGDDEVKAISEITKSGNWGNPDCAGLVEEFEKEFAAYCGTKYALTCVNGSVALRLALIASGVKPGDEVIIPPYTFIATASIVLEANCVPVFVDIEPDTYNINPVEIEKAISDKTKAIIPVHFAGLSCNMNAIMEIAEKYDLTVIEDAFLAHLWRISGKETGQHWSCRMFQFSII